MSKLGRDIRSNVKSGASIPAIVIDVFYGKVTVKLAGNGAIMRNLSVVGGPVEAGTLVQVDFTTYEPTVVALGQEQIELSDISDYIDSLITPGQGSSFTWRVLHFSQGVLMETYTPDATGLADALSDASDGIVMIPAVDISGSFTLSSGVTLVGIDSERSRILGDLLAYGSIANMGIINSASSSSELYAINAQPSTYDESYRNVYAKCTNTGSGDAIGAIFAASRIMRWISSHLEGIAEGAGSGYGIRCTYDQVAESYVRGGYVGGSTFPYLIG